MASQRKDVHVTQRPDGMWQSKVEGNKRATAVTQTQREAIEVGRQSAIKNHSDLSIHGTDGRIREKNSYGNDPHPPKG